LKVGIVSAVAAAFATYMYCRQTRRDKTSQAQSVASDDATLAHHLDVQYYADDSKSRQQSRSAPVRLILIRHGEAGHNLAPGIISGRAQSVPLTDRGKQQAKATAELLKANSVNVDEIYCSTATRAQQTAGLIADGISFDRNRIVANDALVERSDGSHEGRPVAEALSKDVLADMDAHPWTWSAGGYDKDGHAAESPRDVEDRMTRCICEIVRRSGGGLHKADVEISATETPALAVLASLHRIRTVVIVSHLGAIRFFMRRVLMTSPLRSVRSYIDNCGIVDIVYNGVAGTRGGWFLMSWNGLGQSPT